MATKQAERELVTMANHYNWWIHKWRDVQFCPHCRQPIFMTDREQAVPNESIVDYLVFMGHVPVWVECKGKPGETRLRFSDLREKQIDFLTSFYERKVAAAIFITLGTKIPDRFAWLISIEPFMKSVELAKTEYGQKSFPYKPTNRTKDTYDMGIFYDWKLEWKRGIGWILPQTHILVQRLPWVTSLPPLIQK